MDQSEYQSYDATGLAELVASGDVRADELLDLAFERMEQVNPALNAVIFANREFAEQSLAQAPADGPFAGVPFLLKDLGTACTGLPLTSGSRILAGNVPDHDSELVARQKRAGLVIFGRTPSPEFGLTTTTESRIHGVTRNPWHPDFTPGGSSGGAAAAVAAGILPMAHASDGGGSIRVPASACGLFGLKPTRGRIPAGPDTGEGWAGMSIAHAVTRSVRDSAALLDATCGPDTGAPYWAEPPARPFAQEVGAEPGRLRIAVQTETFAGAPIDATCREAVLDAAKLCESLGHHVEEAQFALDGWWLGQATATIAGSNVHATLGMVGRPVTDEDVEYVTRRMAELGAGTTAAEYIRAVAAIHRAGRMVGRFFEDYDIILSPTMAAAPMPHGILSLDNREPSFQEALQQTTGFTSLFNATGNPAMSVPLFWSEEGLPIGVQFAARSAGEATLFRLAGQLEQARPWFGRRPPI